MRFRGVFCTKKPIFVFLEAKNATETFATQASGVNTIKEE